jgi:hypothetical protein
MEDRNLEVTVDVEVVSAAVLLINVVNFLNCLILSPCPFAVFCLAHPLSKKRSIVRLSYELRKEV